MGILFIAFAALFVSGCSGGSYSATAGVQINKLDFDYPLITDQDGEFVALSFELQNVGSKKMPNDGQYWVYGPAIQTGNAAAPTPTWRVDDTNLLTRT